MIPSRFHHPASLSVNPAVNGYLIHVIFSSSQIGRFGISQREIGVSDREILRGKNISYIRKKLALLTLLKINFFIFGCHNPIMQLSSGTAIISKRITGGYFT